MNYVRAYEVLLKDLRELFDFIEPSEANLGCYSFRVLALLLRACVEVEANCKAILRENGYPKGGDLNMDDYKRVNSSHRLHSYEVILPVWHGDGGVRKPFEAWSLGKSLPWYQAYNAAKHDRHDSFDRASFEHLTDAMAGLVVLLSAQFYTYDFGPGDTLMALEGPADGTESSVGSFFRVRYPNDWPPEDQYDFDWATLRNEPDPFQSFDYSSISST